MLSWDFDPPKGGMGRAMQWMAGALRQAGITVDIFRMPPSLRWGGHLLFSFLLPLRLRAWISRAAITRVLLPCGPGGIFLLTDPGIPVTCVVYHTYRQQSRLVPGQWWKRVFIPFERLTLRRADRVLCFSSDTLKVLKTFYHVPETLITHLPQAVGHVRRVSKDEKEEELCVCVARLEARKGVEVLMRAWPVILRAMPGARLILIGEGWLEPQIDTAIRRVGPSVKRIPQASAEELAEIVSRAEAVVCPSYLEGFGLAAAEAMRSGTAVVASDTDGLRNLIEHGKTGLLFERGNKDALAAAVIRCLQDEELRSNMVGTARTFSESFDEDRASAAFVRAAA